MNHKSPSRNASLWRHAFLLALLLAGLAATCLHSYLLFHTLAEFFAIGVAGTMFVMAWNGRRIISHNYLLITGLAFLFIALIDLLHTLSYTGLGLFDDQGGDLPTRLWIAARYLESLTFFGATFFFNRKVNVPMLLALYAAVTTLLLASIFYWDIFPACFSPHQGLTAFKITSEYIIIFILLAALGRLIGHRQNFHRDSFLLLTAAIGLTIASELAFTRYDEVYGLSNLAGHLLKILSFYLLYKAIIENAFLKPYLQLFQQLHQDKQKLENHRDLLIKSQGDLREQTKAQASTLEKEQQRFAFILDNLPAFVFLRRSDHTIAYANRHFKKKFGWTEGQTCHQILYGQNTPCPDCRISAMMATDRPMSWDWVETPDDRIYHVYSYPFQDSDGTAMALQVGMDITERVMAENEITTYSRQLEVKNQELQDFAYVASHDLQEPLRKIITFANLLRTKYATGLDPKGSDYLERMAKAAHRMRTLITALLTYSRVDTNEKSFTNVDLTATVNEVCEDLEQFLQHTGGQVEIGPLATLQADPHQMRQLFQNLISNGLKFNRLETPTVSVSGKRVDPSPPPANLKHLPSLTASYQITITDNGLGFEEQHLDRIFTPFQRLHPRHEFEGTGIGLSICDKIVKRHGGNITAQSRPGHGTTFMITLPLTQIKEA